MAMIVQHNLQAMNSNRQLSITTDNQAKATEKLSSGYKINRAADDAAGLTISEKMRAQVRGLTQASANAQDGISMVQTAEGALSEVHEMLQRMNELAVKAANGTMTSADRAAVQMEIKALTSEINRVQQSTNFNTLYLLSGNLGGPGDGAIRLQVGARGVDQQTIKVSIESMSAKSLGLMNTDGSVVSLSGKGETGRLAAKNYIGTISAAIKKVSQQRSKLGAIQNRLEHTIKNLDNIAENTQAAEAAIRDTDIAKTMVEYSKNNILSQAGQSMLAQANQSTQGALSLLG